MEIKLTNQAIESIVTEALVVITFEKDTAPPAFLAHIPAADLPGKLYESAMYHALPGVKAKRVLAVGGGKREKFGAYELRRAAGRRSAVRTSLKPNARVKSLFMPGEHPGITAAQAVQAAVEGAVIADFDAGRYKTEGRNDDKHLGAVSIAASDTTETRAALERGRIIGESQNFTRDLVNEPGNRMTPTILADQRQKMAARPR